MTVQTETSRSGPYAGSGTTGPFTVGFRFLDNTHLQVIRTSSTGIDSTLVLTTDYSVSGAGGSSGTVTLVSALALGENLTVIRDVPFTQLADYVDNDAFPAESHENALDLLTMQTQQNREVLARSLTLPATTSGVSTELPAPEAGKVVAWNSTGTELQNLDVNTLASVVTYGTAKGDIFSGNGVQTAFVLSENPASINNLDVSIGGVAQRPGLDYTWSSGTTVTFITAPASGTSNILVRYMQALAMGSAVAADVQYVPAGTGSVATNVQAKLLESMSVLDFGADPTGVADSTAAVQAALTFARSSNNEIVVFPAGRYLITDTIDIGPGAKIQGANLDYGGVAGATSYPLQMSDSKGTVIIFAPTTEKSLFVPSLPKGGSMAWNGISIRGLNIWGNTTPDLFHRTELGIVDDITTSLYAIDFEQVGYSNVEDVAIMGFQAGIREGYRCQHNNFNKVDIQRCRVGVLYSAMVNNAEATSSVWRNCTIRTAAVAVQCVDTAAAVYSGDSLQIRFHGCYFEDISNYGFLLSRMAKDWCFIDCYGEQIGRDTSVATRACFWVGATAGLASGSDLNSVSIFGGQYAGDDSAASIFLQADYTDGVNLIGCTAKRFGVGISATANTRDKSIYMANPLFNSVTTLFSGTTNKTHGIYRTVTTEGGSDVVIVRTNYVAAEGELELSGSTIRLGDGSTTSARPGGDNTMSSGTAGARWSNIYSYGLNFPATQVPIADVNTLDDYQEYTAPSTACTGAITTAVVWKVTKIGNQVTLTLPATSGAAVAASAIVFGAALPTEFRPAAGLGFICPVRDNGTNQATPGIIIVSTTGVITLYKDSAATSFTFASTCGIGQGVGLGLSWTI